MLGNTDKFRTILKNFFAKFNKFARSSSPLKQITRILFFTVIIQILFGLLYYLAEGRVKEELTIWDSLWWALVTCTTVGYGDFYPVTFVGRFLISFPLMILGIGIVGYLIGISATTLIDYINKKKYGKMKIKEQDHIVICNYPCLDKILTVCKELRKDLNMKKIEIVIVSDKIEELPDELHKHNILFVKGSPTRLESLERAGIFNSKGIIILSENPTETRSDERNYTIASIIQNETKNNNWNGNITVEIVSNNYREILQKIGIQRIVSTEGIEGCLIAQEFITKGVQNIFADLLNIGLGHEITLHTYNVEETTLTKIREFLLKKNVTIPILGLIKDNKTCFNPPTSTVINKNDQLIVLKKVNEDLSILNNII